MKIYTRTGDDGTTGLYRGGRITKSSLRIEAIGDLDELNSWLGMVRTIAQESSFHELVDYAKELQEWLFNLGAVLAENPEKSKEESKTSGLVQEEQIEQMERWIDEISEHLPPLKYFVLAGGSRLNAQLHVARSVCRRAERSMIRLFEAEGGTEVGIKLVNRLSDLLFVMARRSAQLADSQEYFWIPESQGASSAG